MELERKIMLRYVACGPPSGYSSSKACCISPIRGSRILNFESQISKLEFRMSDFESQISDLWSRISNLSVVTCVLWFILVRMDIRFWRIRMSHMIPGFVWFLVALGIQKKKIFLGPHAVLVQGCCPFTSELMTTRPTVELLVGNGTVQFKPTECGQ